ncbi:EAL domain-containing protein [Enterobacter sp. E12]|uniref:EAL domain-containing protein n=1 Tax=Enterobacter TaxID=547 RepID=UPI0004471C33|nr:MULTISPECIES: EAL domain-containing protein [Enterobacter]EUM07518.1 diguanylate phosphodiesterase [Enterobacter sp. BIDMC 29]MBD0816837.1 EAL domain-containing protein [Enterobacter sp. E12]
MTAQNLTYTPPRLKHISHDITGIKLEPIVALASSHRIGVEVLSILSPALQSEDFFREQSAEQSLMLLEVQLGVLKNALACNNIFINLPITVLMVPELFQRLLQLRSPPLNIEIVDPVDFFTLSDTQRQGVAQRLKQLTMKGHRIWLDDIDETVIQPFLFCRLPLNGIKIDKGAFWRLRATPALRQLVSRCFQLAGSVLIEGIETERDRTWALQAGADLGQGYYWPSWTWPED